jgi:hypothetical protein
MAYEGSARNQAPSALTSLKWRMGMQRSSGSIGSLAAALAKAQGELTNPEKSLVGTIRPDDPDGGERTFRYASLSSGLDIVRKVLGQHEIATMQTTAIDQAAGIVNLTTVLAHASGEWIASDWPVCTISDMATPHRMGMALTYARRYSLFALAGIAGEDDLDAPDLVAPTNASSGEGTGHAKAAGKGKLNGGRDGSVHRSAARRDARVRPPKEILGSEASAELRDRLIAELDALTSSDDAGLWAHHSLPQKNKLTAADALQVEAAFEGRVASYTAAEVSSKSEALLRHCRPRGQRDPGSVGDVRLSTRASSRLRNRAGCAIASTSSSWPPIPA